MPLPSSINDLSQTASANSPAGSESPGLIDDYLRTYASYIAILRDTRLGLFLGAQKFSSSGTYTPGVYTVGGQSITATKARFRWVGGGGGGGGCQATSASQAAAAGGGNGGSYMEAIVTSGLASQSITIGAAGSGGVAGANAGTAGGSTIVGTIGTATGGAGGGAGGAGTPPYVSAGQANSGGGAISGSLVINRGNELGAPGMAMSITSSIGGQGGHSPFGVGGKGGAPGTGFGSGGGGAELAASSSATAGQNGTAGYVIVEEYA